MDSYWISPDGHETLVPMEPPCFNHSEAARLMLEEVGASMPADESKDELIRRGWIRVSEMETFEFSGRQGHVLVKRFVESHLADYDGVASIEIDDHEGHGPLRVYLHEFVGVNSV